MIPYNFVYDSTGTSVYYNNSMLSIHRITDSSLDKLSVDRKLLEECKEIYIYQTSNGIIEFLEKFENLKILQISGPSLNIKMRFTFPDLSRVKVNWIYMDNMNMDRLPVFNNITAHITIGNSRIQHLPFSLENSTVFSFYNITSFEKSYTNLSEYFTEKRAENKLFMYFAGHSLALI
jgi:hypothetical protein